MIKLRLAILLALTLLSLPCMGQSTPKSGVEIEHVGPKTYSVRYPSLISLTVRGDTISASLAQGQTIDPKMQLVWIVVSEKEGQVLSQLIHSPLPFDAKLHSLLFLTGNAKYSLFIQTTERPQAHGISNIVEVSKHNGRYLIRKQSAKR
ncbi:MAG: hypothetical protein NTY98_09365 [Verrucomicrobia bacterium]|nr:hypothetical protein [Verrucomicrobiota bacterium]